MTSSLKIYTRAHRNECQDRLSSILNSLDMLQMDLALDNNPKQHINQIYKDANEILNILLTKDITE